MDVDGLATSQQEARSLSSAVKTEPRRLNKMRELVADILSTIDGFYEGPAHDFRYADKYEDDEFKRQSTEHLRNFATLMFGGRTYDLGKEYWTTDLATKASENPIVIDQMNGYEKVLVSTRDEAPDWGPTSQIKTDLIENVKNLKAQDGLPILLIGSTSVRTELLKAGLIDRINIWNFPLILGEGNSLFKDLGERITLKVERVQTYANGNYLVEYVVPKKEAA
jgi:dihydrofolate reductase